MAPRGRGRDGLSLTKGQVVVPAEPASVSSVNVQVDVVKLQTGDGMGNTLLVHGASLGAELDALVGDDVGQRIRLQDDGEGEVRGGGDLLGVGRDELGLVALEAVLVAAQLTRALACGTLRVMLEKKKTFLRFLCEAFG